MAVNEADTRATLIEPKLKAAGWTDRYVTREYYYQRDHQSTRLDSAAADHAGSGRPGGDRRIAGIEILRHAPPLRRPRSVPSRHLGRRRLGRPSGLSAIIAP
jgi:hypothetical protein